MAGYGSSRLAGVAAVAALVLTGCASGGTPTAAEPPPPPVGWQECGPGLECGTVEVPLEYTDPGGEQVPLAVLRRPATDPDRRVGSLLFNPGGPGVSATGTLRTMPDLPGAPGAFTPEVLARFDVVAVDPRGVGDSRPVRCRTDAERAGAAATTAPDPAVPGGLPLPELLATATAFTGGCAEHQDPAFLASMSTDNVARDLDRVRAALGEDRITYYGISYGTVVGPVYATMFPDRVRQMVLDAPVDTGLWFGDPLPFLGEVAVASEQTLDAWFDACRAEGPATCPFGGGDPERAFDALIDRLEAAPLPVADGTPVDGAKALDAARSIAGERTTWPLLTAALLAAERGDGTALHLMNAAVTVSPFTAPTAVQEAHIGVRCADWHTPADVAAHTAAAGAVVGQAPRIGPRAAYAALDCALWPARDTERVTGPFTAAGAPPTLVVGGRLDPVTPHHWAESMTRTLDSAVLLTREGVGHGSYGPDPCVNAAVDAALLDGVLPADGTVCTPAPATTDPAALTGAGG